MSFEAFAQTQPFHPNNNNICSQGRTLEFGCKQIRAREIVDAKQKPYSAIGRINYAGYRSRQHCTGTLISPEIVLTAAHCLFARKAKRWLKPEEIIFVAGYDRSEYIGFSKVQRYEIDMSVQNKRADRIRPLSKDWAILELSEPIGRIAGYLETSTNIPSTFSMAGYAGLRPHVLTVGRTCQEVENKSINKGRLLLHNCAIMGGDSGGPVLANSTQQTRLIGISTAVLTGGKKNTAISILVTEIPIKTILEKWGYK